jgi:hypothetical protein
MPNLAIAYQKWQDVWQKRRLTIVFGTVYLLLSCFAMTHFLNSSFLGDRYFKTTFDGMYEQTTYKPFVYRQLIPAAARILTAISPQVVQDYVNDRVERFRRNPQMQTVHVTMPWTYRAFPSYGKHYQRIVTIVLIFGCMWGYIWALARLARELFPISRAMACFAPVFGVLLISSFSFPFQYVYDIPVLFLSTVCYLAMATRNWRLFIGAYILACLNKETAIFMTLFFAIWFWGRLDKRSYINLLVMQYVIYALLRLGLLYLYQDNPGQYLKNHLFRVLPGDVLVTSQYERVFMIAWGFFLMTYQWAKKPAFLKCSLLLLPPMYVAYLLYGMPGEYRVFFDVLPLPLLLAVHTLVDGTGLGRAAFFNASSTPQTGVIHDSND